MSNTEKAKFLADQIGKCRPSFKDGFIQGVVIALNISDKEKDQQSIEFAEWVAESRWEIDVKGKWWDLNDELEGITSEELLKLWKEEQNELPL